MTDMRLHDFTLYTPLSIFPLWAGIMCGHVDHAHSPLDFAGNNMLNFPRPRPIDKALAAFNASLPREGRIARQCRYCLIVNGGIASMRQLREYCYHARPRRHWHHGNIARTLKRLGAERIGWGIYATCVQHDARNAHE
jgi:hypothetical protein